MTDGRGPWRTATVVGMRPETPSAKSYRLRFDGTFTHLAGQHVVLRLTAPDGYTASRSYSIASPPDDSRAIELTVERLDEGEVSTFLHDELRIGDELELRGPIGGFFVWRGDSPALLVGGGSGVVPLMAMLRLARQTGHDDLVRLVVSTRSPGDLYYRDELSGPAVSVIYTRAAPAETERPAGRLRQEDLAPALLEGATAYICGSSGFADAAGELLAELGVGAERIRIERFGPTGT